jgi:hypothetical protein
MRKRSTSKPPKTDIFDAVVQDVELTVEQVAESAKESVEGAAKALTRMVKRKDPAPSTGRLVTDRRVKPPRGSAKDR